LSAIAQREGGCVKLCAFLAKSQNFLARIEPRIHERPGRETKPNERGDEGDERPRFARP
jgi:hypothetical protein